MFGFFQKVRQYLKPTPYNDRESFNEIICSSSTEEFLERLSSAKQNSKDLFNTLEITKNLSFWFNNNYRDTLVDNTPVLERSLFCAIESSNPAENLLDTLRINVNVRHNLLGFAIAHAPSLIPIILKSVQKIKEPEDQQRIFREIIGDQGSFIIEDLFLSHEDEKDKEQPFIELLDIIQFLGDSLKFKGWTNTSYCVPVDGLTFAEAFIRFKNAAKGNSNFDHDMWDRIISTHPVFTMGNRATNNNHMQHGTQTQEEEISTVSPSIRR